MQLKCSIRHRGPNNLRMLKKAVFFIRHSYLVVREA